MVSTKCFQCGHPLILAFPEDEENAEWLVCDHCGARALTQLEARQQYDAAVEEQARDALGFYDWKPGSH